MNVEEAIKHSGISAERLGDILMSKGIRYFDGEVESDALSVTTDEEANEVANAGELCKIKTLFEGPPRCQCCINWVEERPNDLRQSVEDEEESMQHALLVRMMNNHGEGRPLKLHSIVVQSFHLKSVVGDLFQGYGGITTTLKKLVFKSPFHPFFYEWDRLNQLACGEQDPVRKDHIRLLKRVLKSELKETISTSKDLDHNNVITFDYLWTVFKPGIDIYTDEDGHACFCRLEESHYGSNDAGRFLQLKANQIDHNGKIFGYRARCFCIFYFQGTKSVEELDVIPASRLSLSEEMKVRATKRGMYFREIYLKDYHYAAYKGIAIERHNRRNIDGRIVIDSLAYEAHNGSILNLKVLEPRSLRPGLDVSDQKHAHHGRFVCGNASRAGRENPSTSPQSQVPDTQKRGPAELPDDLLYLCSPALRGYSLKTKRWATFYVDFIQAIRWNDLAFDNLVLEGGYKRMITSFVESHVANKEAFDDIIEGKGQGIIMLLEGPPGVGKTLTAEAVADKVRQPLYAISAGELGATAGEVEKSLTLVLEVAAKWGAVLLLDEGDVFLEKRSANSLGQNGIVAIFLRLLEYYRGILFMTTNRVEAIDPAFQSRIHVTIRYPPLRAEARRQIWKRFIENSQPDTTVKEKDFDELKRIRVNGREIKNLAKTAQLLASHEETPLSIEHIRTIIRVTSVSRAAVDDANRWKRFVEYWTKLNYPS
ncbi:putative AAA family ATPase [Annulohypoxylon bovei var. microspora]|nr:putative AAA family ATPase [Annulohypoxylon bovei var. microspora]